MIGVTVKVNNVSSNEGTIIVCVFDKPDAFPDQVNLAVKCVKVKASQGIMKIQVDGLTQSDYAFAVHHDKNNDGKVNTNFIGIPKEPIGASNGAKGKMGPPKYADAVVTIAKEIAIILE